MGLGEVDLPLSGSEARGTFFRRVSGSSVYESDLDLSLGESSKAVEGLTLGGRFWSCWGEEDHAKEVLEGLYFPEEEDRPFCLSEEEREPGLGDSARSPVESRSRTSAFRACRVLWLGE